MTSQYEISALAENSSPLLLRLIACLVRHRIEIVSVDWIDGGRGTLFQLDLLVRADADHVRRAVKQMGACVGVAGIDYRMEEDDSPGAMSSY
ncbi:MAG: hypothetical protein OXU69_13590 [Gemmatimonadota bacterium]|nr:hypothetical protein [Gemmatimonadota bacterium]MDE2985732.1 hypothetical protein [Gemmatimonadota bacterium]